MQWQLKFGCHFDGQDFFFEILIFCDENLITPGPPLA